MMLRRAFLIAYLLLTMQLATAADFSQGQVWSYRTRPSEPESSVLINLVETDPRFGKIFHISVRGVLVKNKQAPSGITTELPHFPVSRGTLEKSLVALQGRDSPNPDYREGYETWKQAFDAGRAGVFDASVAEIVDLIEGVVSK